MQRRSFIKLCSAAAAAQAPCLAGGVLAATESKPKLYTRSKLVEPSGAAVRARSLPVEANLIFNYPYASTPCFLLRLAGPTRTNARLNTADRRAYEWTGGVGAERSIVAYSAICAHQLSYPTRDISFISYRAETSERNRFGKVIHCCSEHSQYDPAEGGRVLAGPAPQALAAILLEHDAASDELYAVGTLGGELFNEFFARYEFRLTMEHGRRTRERVGPTCPVERMENYCRQQVKC